MLSLLIGVPLLAAILLFFQHMGPYAWLTCWITVVVFMLIMQFLVPTVIMPLFSKFEPIEEGELKKALMDYAASIKFPLTHVFRMDGSKRSSKSNAFFTGFGNSKRIVLFDTLIEQHTVPELVGVLAHEMGHFKLNHIKKTLAIGIIQSGVVFFILSLCLSQQGLFDAFYMENMSVYAGLVFFGMLFTPIDFFTNILMNMYSRKNEYEADHFAVTTTKDNRSLKDALIKLSVNNLGNLFPHPFYVHLNYSHPPLIERIERIEKTPAV
ncbi:MAG: M48 family metallopeptidase [Desulfobacteraceae bacterium]